VLFLQAFDSLPLELYASGCVSAGDSSFAQLAVAILKDSVPCFGVDCVPLER